MSHRQTVAIEIEFRFLRTCKKEFSERRLQYLLYCRAVWIYNKGPITDSNDWLVGHMLDLQKCAT